MIPSITAILWKYFQKADKSFPIKIRVTYRQASKYFPINFESAPLCLTAAEWTEVKSERTTNRRLKVIRNQVVKCEAEARKLCEDLTLNGKRPFSFGQFKQKYAGDRPTSFLGTFDVYLDSLLLEERMGTHRSYLCAKSAIERYLGDGNDIQTHELTPEFLRKFEHHLLGDSASTMISSRFEFGTRPNRTVSRYRTILTLNRRTLIRNSL